MYWNIDRIMKLLISLCIAAVLVWLIRYLSDVLLPFFVACFVAYLLQPIVEFNKKWMHTKGRTLASIVTVIDVSAILVLLIYIFLPGVIREVDMLGDIIKRLSEGKEPVPAYVQTVIDNVQRYADPEKIKGLLGDMHIQTLLNKGSSLLSESVEVLAQVLSWALTLIYVLFILIDYPQIVRGFKLIFPHKYRDKGLEVVRDVKDSLNHYFRGQGLVAICAAVFYCIGFSIIGLPLAIPMGVMVGLLYMIPYFQYITIIPVAVIAFIYSLGGGPDFLTMAGRCAIVYVVSQSICDYIITPHIMGKEMGMNPAIILLSLSVWGSLLGIIGMIIALPVSALIMSYYEKYISEPRGKDANAAVTVTNDSPSPDDSVK